MKILTFAVVWTIALLTGGCGNHVPPGPPIIHYGQDACAGCGMIISDERFASALVISTTDAPALLFDDIGCMLRYEHDQPALSVQRFFHDAETRKWIDESHAALHKSGRNTPMGSGLIALTVDAGPHPSATSPSATRPETQNFTYQQLRDESPSRGTAK
jgi:hypothetical protein